MAYIFNLMRSTGLYHGSPRTAGVQPPEGVAALETEEVRLAVSASQDGAVPADHSAPRLAATVAAGRLPEDVTERRAVTPPAAVSEGSGELAGGQLELEETVQADARQAGAAPLTATKLLEITPAPYHETEMPQKSAWAPAEELKPRGKSEIAGTMATPKAERAPSPPIYLHDVRRWLAGAPRTGASAESVIQEPAYSAEGTAVELPRQQESHPTRSKRPEPEAAATTAEAADESFTLSIGSVHISVDGPVPPSAKPLPPPAPSPVSTDGGISTRLSRRYLRL